MFSTSEVVAYKSVFQIKILKFFKIKHGYFFL